MTESSPLLSYKAVLRDKTNDELFGEKFASSGYEHIDCTDTILSALERISTAFPSSDRAKNDVDVYEPESR